MAATWREDIAFVAWLVAKQYARMEGAKVVHSFSGDGIVMYMWEAWRAALGHP